MTPSEQLSQGISAAQAGKRVEARALLTEALKTDETHADGWWWLGQVVDSLDDKTVCLENVLVLDPNHTDAQAELAWVKEQQDKLFRPVYAPGDELPREGISPLSAAATMPITTAYPDTDEFDNPWLCPYCMAPTHPKDKSCPRCKQPLVITRRVSVERSAWLWRGIFLQIGLIMTLTAAWAVSYALIFRYNRIPQSLSFLPLYLGRPVEQPAELAERALAVYPLWVFWSFAAAIFVSFLLILPLYFRVKHGNTLYMISATAMLGVSLTLFVFFHSSSLLLTVGGFALIFGAAQLLVALNLWNDFKFKSERLRLVIEGGVKNHASFFLVGRKYAELGMWGLAVIHYRRAVGRKEDNPVYHLALGIAYIKINRYDLAKKSLEKAEQLDPDSPEIWQLRQQIESEKPISGRLRRPGAGMARPKKE